MSSPADVTPQARLRALQITVMTVAGALIAMAVVSWFVLDPDTPFVAVRLLLALGIVVGTVLVGRLVGLRVNPLPGTTPPARAAGEATQRIAALTFPAFALAEVGGLVCFALGFVLPMSRVTVAVALVAGAVGTLWAALPAGSRLRSLVTTLESEGVHTGLSQ